MKKMYLLVVLLSVLLTSCVWTPTDEVYKLKEKTSCTNFESLSEPVIIPIKLIQNFSKGKNDSNDVCFGSAIVVYDWKKNKVFDYFYTKEQYSFQPFTAIKNSAGVVNHYYFDKNLTVISPGKPSLKKEKISENNLYLRTLDNGCVLNRDMILPYIKASNINSSDEVCDFGIKILDKETGKITDGEDFRIESSCQFLKMANDNICIQYFLKDVENEVVKVYIREWDTSKKTFGEEELVYEENLKEVFLDIPEDELIFDSTLSVQVKYVDDDYVILRNDFGKGNCNFIVINRNDKTERKIAYPYGYSNVQILNLNNQLYVFYTINDWESDEKTGAYRMDLEKGSLENCHVLEKSISFEYTFVRDNQVYFCETKRNSVSIMKFDPVLEKYQDAITIDVNSLLAGMSL